MYSGVVYELLTKVEKEEDKKICLCLRIDFNFCISSSIWESRAEILCTAESCTLDLPIVSVSGGPYCPS